MKSSPDGLSVVSTTCPYCGVGCGVDVQLHRGEATGLAGTANHPANLGKLCVKGSALLETLGHESRLLNPQVGKDTCSWDYALDATASGLRRIIDQYGPDAVAIYASGQLLTEDYYVANKLMKGFIGSANIDTNSRLCMSSAVTGYKRAFGSDSVPCDYSDLEQADLIVIAGSNTAWAHPVVYQRIVAAKRARPHLRIVTIDPRHTATNDLSDLHLSLAPGSDALLFNALLHDLATKGHIDKDYTSAHTQGLRQALDQAQDTASCLDEVAEATGLALEDIRTFFNWFGQTPKTVTLFSQGLNQSANGSDNANAVINCHLATGRIAKLGTGPFSLTGQPNAMGGREAGGLATQLAAHMELDDPQAVERVRTFWQTDNIADKPGLKAVDLFDAIASGSVRAVWIMGTNPAVSMPQANKVSSALRDCELVIVSDVEAKTDTTALADILLPALAWSEKDGSVTNSERRISRQRAFMLPAGNAQADWWIISEVAKRMGYAKAFDYQSSADIFREHAALSQLDNDGTRDFDIGALAALTDTQYQQLNPVQWPCPADGKAGKLFSDGKFFTASGQANFVPIKTSASANNHDKHPYVLNSGRIRDQWHTMTRTAKASRLVQHSNEPFVEIHPRDAAKERITDGQLLRLKGEAESLYIAKAKISKQQREGSLFVPIHWSNQFSASAKASSMVSGCTDPYSGQPAFKHARVSLEAVDVEWRASIICRNQIASPDCLYWTRIPQEHTQRMELSSVKPLLDKERWLSQLCGVEGSWMSYQDDGDGTYRTACVIGLSVQAVIYYSEKSKLPKTSGLEKLFESDLTFQNRHTILTGQLSDAASDCGRIVCACRQVGENTIRHAIRNRGLTDTEVLGKHLGCGTSCGSCLPEIKSLLSDTLRHPE